jgi:7-alpha-hydroxysteroid dehydrogenase
VLTTLAEVAATRGATSASSPAGWTAMQESELAPISRSGATGQPEDLIGAAIYLATPASAFATGVVLRVDGGFALPSSRCTLSCQARESAGGRTLLR